MKKFFILVPLLGVALGGCDRQQKFSPVDMWNRSRYKPLEPEPFFADGSSSRTIPVGTVARGQLRIDETLYAGRKRGTGVAPADMNYGWLGNGGTIGGNFNGAGSQGTRNDLNRDGDLTGNGRGRTTSTNIGRGINTLSSTDNNLGGAGAGNGGNGVDRAVGDNGLGTSPDLATEFPFPITKALLSRGQERYNINCTPCHGATAEGNGMIVQRGFPAPPSLHIPRLQQAPIGHYFDVITHGYGAMYSYSSRVEPRDRWAIISYIRLLQQSRLTQVRAGKKFSVQYDTPRTTPSPGATIMNGSSHPGLSQPGMKQPGTKAPGTAHGAGAPHAAATAGKVRLNNDRIAANAKRGTATR